MEGSGAPVAVSDPAVFYSPATSTKHVIYRGPFGHLFELWFVPGGQPAVVDLTLEARAPRAVGRPAASHLPYGGPFVKPARRRRRGRLWRPRRPEIGPAHDQPPR